MKVYDTDIRKILKDNFSKTKSINVVKDVYLNQ